MRPITALRGFVLARGRDFYSPLHPRASPGIVAVTTHTIYPGDFSMPMLAHTEYDGLAALGAVRELTSLLINKGLITKNEGIGVFIKCAELHEEVSKEATTSGNKSAAQSLRECIEQISDEC